jgi:hypothetical protein
MLNTRYAKQKASDESRGNLELAMDSGRAKKLESVVSISLLSILFLIALGVLIRQSNYNMSRFGIETAADESVTVNLNSLSPADFKTLSEETYLADNLYEKINGKAPLYIESGFVKLFTKRFISNEDETLWMELFIFDMANIKNAFSVYSVQRRPDVEFLPDMQFGYRTSDATYFVHGKYYIEFTPSSKSEKLFYSMMETVQKIQTNLPIDKVAYIPELDLFPKDNLVAGSQKLYLASAFGFEKLTDTFTAQYRLGDDTVTAFLSKRPSAADAVKLFENYHKFLIENGGKETPTDNNPNVKYVDFYGTLEIVTVAGPFVFGIHEAENPQLASNVEKLFINKFREMGVIPKK